MGYEIAINKAWDALAKITKNKNFSVKFLADTYDINLKEKKVLSLSCNAAAKDFSAILILHYLIAKLQGLSNLSGEWVPFKEVAGTEGYSSAFKKRSIEPIIRKYGNNPEGLLSILERLPSKKSNLPDVSVIIEVFEEVPILIRLWRRDEEFGPDANIFFDKNITGIFCTEDIVVLAGIVASAI
ncbi:MAG: DUF3786 domain-containing protein [Candidatus Omnitrophota bacterium]